MQLRPLVPLFLALGIVACGGGGDDTDASSTDTAAATSEAGETETTAGTSASSDTDATSDTGLPEGESTWEGTLAVNSMSFAVEVAITNTGGDLVATVAIVGDDLLGATVFRATGTHEPTAGRVAFAPDAWIDEPDFAIELIGLIGAYDPAMQRITGTVVDYASGGDNSLLGGPATLTLIDGPGAATTAGDAGASLFVGSQTFTGTSQCTGPVRDISGTLDYDGAGLVSGALTLGDPGLDAPLGTFAVSGVHNPTTGGLTLVPGLWDSPDHNTKTFFVDGTLDANASAFAGDMRTDVDACPDDTFHAVFE